MRAGNGAQSEELLALSGVEVRDSSRLLGALYVVPVPARAGAATSTVDRRSALRRRIWTVALAASVASAAAALLLAGPIVRRIRRLADAAASIRSGVLDVRVKDSGADELTALSHSFNAMAESLSAAKQQQRNLVSDVAHELRTPLTNVVGLVEAMQDGLRAPDVQTLSTLRAEVGLLAALVHELQELSLAESGQLTFEITSVDAVGAAREAIEAVAAQDGQAEIQLVVAHDQLFVRADKRRLGQILRNLLRNALTHTPRDGRIVLTIESQGDNVAIVVADTGRGIPPEHVQLVFERFHRVDPSRDRASGGMGLGLAVVRQLTTAMNGRVWVESEVGRGSRFGVELPASVTAGAA
jgi:signal transduction histidine kinase